MTAARVVAAEVLADVRRGMLLDPAFDRRATAVDARDRRWVQELVWGMLRRRAWLDALLEERVSGGLARLDADLVDLLRLGLYQLLAMGSVPAYAAIAQTVELAKRRHGLGASRLANAVLRRADRDLQGAGGRGLAPARPADAVAALALAESHPEWLVARWVARWGVDETARLLAANNAEAPIVVRAYGVVPEALAAELAESGVATAERRPDVPWPSGSLALAPGAALAELGAYRQGHFHVQDPGSTWVTEYAAIAPGSTVADVCAAPGGKAAELARTAEFVYAGDRSPARLRRVVGNLARLGLGHVLPYVGDARTPPLRPVDAVLVDAPCTGTGTFRRHPDARWRLKVSDLAVMSAVQRQILRSAAAVVRPGGLLIYSTCSLEPEENDAPVDGFLADHPGWALEPPPAGTVPEAVLDAGRLRVLPHRHGSDGAFAARLRRGEG